MSSFPLAPLEVWHCFWRNRALIKALTQREIAGRYRGSVLGLLWSFFHPVFMLTVYTFVFSVVFKARWGGGESRAEFALVLFAGLLVFNLFAECISKAPTLILANPTYVKKVVFPLEVLPWVNLGAALFHLLVSLGVWLLFYLAIFGMPPATILFFPLLLAPLVLLSMGMSWLLASLGVYLRDIGQIIGILITALMFLTPIFYPVAAIPAAYQLLLKINPLTNIIDQSRNLLIFGKGPDWGALLMMTMLSAVVAWLGLVWFQKTRQGFADVL